MKKNLTFLKEQLHLHFKDVFEKKLINEIAKNGTYATYEKNDILIDIGLEMTHIPLIINGLVKISREDTHEKEILLYFLEEGDTCAISFVNCIHLSKSMFRATAEEPVECIMFPVNKIEEWMINYKTWRVFIIDSYHTRLEEMLSVIKDLAFFKLENRIYKYLSNQVKIKHTDDLIITHQEIANDLNTSRVVISRILKNLEQEGKIKLNRRNIHVSKY
ncbi:Crp/Fnr family transcriptional regulator [uncultured Algibacter sp.]|uniref:Crp/Fnr family transcriptional regulator n=1 Tax=uncultured Algibacter sp. TaxID=298659 RepID=UPI00263374DC|nr:Crp/Fnr family transcriptional regulator [uncultured Algibacter sp.]